MKDSYILGISAFYHDSAATILKNGEIVAAAQEERFTRKKHDHRFPENAVQFCLKTAGISSEDLQYVAFYDKPWIKFERLLETYISFAPQGFPSFIKAMPLWLKEKLWMGDQIKKSLSYEGEIVYPEHHQSHAASAFFPSPYKSSAIITVDGVGEWTTSSWGVGRDNKIDLQAELKFPHSLGLLYSAFTYYCGFRVNSGEYKLMGLAPYGNPRYVDLILDNVIDAKADGSFRMDQSYFNYCQGLTMTSKKFDELFGAPARSPESELEQRHMDIAASIQVVTEKIMLDMARHVRKVTGEKNLVLAGGVALNCVANGKIIKANIFDSVWVQPAAGDAGGALGAALYAWHQILDKPRAVKEGKDLQKASLLGPGFSSAEIKEWLDTNKIPYASHTNGGSAKHAAQLMSEGKVLGWFAGKTEFGPRALGARSIIGDPRNTEMQSVMNLKIKYRESFRPFAPACLREKVGDYFDFDADSPYMLVVAPVKEERRRKMTEKEQSLFGIEKLKIQRSDLPAITHVDYSARIQTVAEDENPKFHSLIKEFEKLTGCGVIINTSFNVRGEPIVCTPEDAYRCFMRTEMDALVLEDFVLLKNEQPKFEDKDDWRSEYELD